MKTSTASVVTPASAATLPTPNRVYFLLLTVTLFWGTSYAAAKIGMQNSLPLHLALIRFILASLIFGTILLLRKKTILLDRRDIPEFLLLGFMAISAYYYVHYQGLLYTSSTHAGLLIATSPMFSVLFCLGSGQETVSRQSILGIIFAFCGVSLVITQGSLANLYQPETLLGDGLILLNSLMWAWVTLKGKSILAKYSPFVAMAYIHIFGTLLLLPFVFIATPLAKVPLWQVLPQISPATWGAALYLAVCCSVYSYYMWYVGVATIGAVKTAVFNYLNPVMAAFSGWLLFQEQLSAYVLTGGSLVLFGLYLTNKRLH